MEKIQTSGKKNNNKHNEALQNNSTIQEFPHGHGDWLSLLNSDSLISLSKQAPKSIQVRFG